MTKTSLWRITITIHVPRLCPNRTQWRVSDAENKDFVPCRFSSSSVVLLSSEDADNLVLLVRFTA
jgi:hypothetical protein